ncbi:MAG TPA: hypothetical protein PKL77_10845, partial [Candidatus Omnitrophota bacterium]|nr:hypothetical protein [Candidatus Omnitrophota bacterium]
KEVAYIKGNLGASGFGASAFVDIYNLKVENGVTPEGLEYNAIANDLRATHVALAPHVRDPENKIKVTNAVCVRNTGEMMEVENAEALDKNGKPLKIGDTASHYKFGKGKIVSVDTKSYSVPHVSFVPEEGAFKGEKIFKLSAEFVKNSHGEKFNKEVESMEPKEIAALVKNAVEEAIAAKNSEDRMGALEERVDKIGNALNEINEKLDGKKAEGENAAFEGKETPEEEAEEKKAEEGSPVGNAKPSQEMVKAFATAYNVDFGGKTPSFATLAAFAGIKETDAVARIAAVNAKFNEIKGATAQNTEHKSASVSEVF